MPACHYACNTADHIVSRRTFLGAASAAAALGPAGFASLGRQRGTGPGAEARAGHLPVRRREPTRNVGPQAEHRHRRPVPGHPDVGPRHAHLRAAAAHGEADAPHGPRPRPQQPEGRPRQRHDDHADRPQAGAGDRRIRTSARSRRGCSAPTPPRCPATSRSCPRAAAASAGADAAFLGPKFASVTLGDGKPPANLLPPDGPRRRRRRGARRVPQEAQRPLREVAQDRPRPRPTPNRSPRPSAL